MTHREAIIVMSLLPGIGPGLVRQMLQVFAGPADVLRESAARLAKVSGLGAKRAEVLSNWRRHVDLDEELRLCDQAGVEVVTVHDDAYPELLREIHDPPLCLYVRGSLDPLQRVSDRGLAIVGSRRTTRYGETSTEFLTAAAVNVGFVIVSGLARGIDTVAHRTCVTHRGPQIAVIAGGLAHITPTENIELARDIVEHGGAVLSEQPLRMPPDKRMFPMRNRIIAGMTRGTLVMEAGHGSGSLITAELAVTQGRQVFAVPGRIDVPTSAGCHKLIQDGAKLVTSIDDIVAEFAFLPGMQPKAEVEARQKRSAARAFGGARSADPGDDELALFDAASDDDADASRDAARDRAKDATADLDPLGQRLVAALRASHEMHVDDLIAAAQGPVPLVLSTLLQLELKRVVKQLPGRSYTLWR